MVVQRRCCCIRATWPGSSCRPWLLSSAPGPGDGPGRRPGSPRHPGPPGPEAFAAPGLSIKCSGPGGWTRLPPWTRCQETRQAAQNKKRDMVSLTRLPFAYTLYRLGVKRYLANPFPGRVGHPMGPLRRKRDSLQPRTCLYQEVTQALGCPELCPLYCENDDIAFSGLAPKILFRRTGTLASGAPCCDFHFLRSR